MNSSGSHAFVNQFLIYALVAICGCGSIGLGTVWMRHEISIAANESRLLEGRIADVERRIQETDAAIAAEQDPEVLTRRNEQWHLGLVPPVDAQVSRVTVDPVTRLAAEHNLAIFGDGPPRILSLPGHGPDPSALSQVGSPFGPAIRFSAIMRH